MGDSAQTKKLLRTLSARIDELIAMLGNVGEEHASELARVHLTHASGAENMLHYTALRTQDLRPLQAGLADFGATRLSTTEPAVLGRLKAARHALATFAGEPSPYEYSEIADAFARADEILDAHADDLLGPIEDAALVESFVSAGMDLARINAAHGEPKLWLAMIENVRRAAQAAGRDIRIAIDLAGPKLRTGPIAPGPQVGRARVTRTQAGEVTQPARVWLYPREGQRPGQDSAEPRGSRLAAPEFPDGRPVLAIAVDADWLGGLHPGEQVRVNDARGSKRKLTVVEVRTQPDGAPGTDGPGAERGVDKQDAENDAAAISAPVCGALCEARQNVYVAEGSLLEHNWVKVRAHGIAPTEQRLRLREGDRLWLSESPEPAAWPTAPGEIPQLGCTLPEAVRAITVGDRVLFDDGVIAARVIARDDGTQDGAQAESASPVRVLLEVTRTKVGGANLAAFKGINLPDTELPVTSLTPEDRETLEFAARHADIANVSFIRNPSDVDNVLAALRGIAERALAAGDEAAARRAHGLGVVLKIETIPAYEALPEIMLAGMQHQNFGLMIARGDLAVELGFERMAEVPGLILAAAEAAHVPTIMATQVLESLAKDGLPTRAEITDAAFALRAEAVMLNKGPHIPTAIELLTRMSQKLGRSQRKNRMLMRKINSWVPASGEN